MKKTFVFGGLSLFAAAMSVLVYSQLRSSTSPTGEFCSINCRGKNACCAGADSEKPISSCSLSAEAQHERLNGLSAALFSKAQSSAELPDGFELVFPDDDGTRSELEAFVAFEQKCCSNATWELAPFFAERAIRLRITGDAGFKKELARALPRLGQD
ncbi:MAG: hypothetical protein KIS77_20810 [Saprospiraceae bacterium]|nr:hypothetical protein [Saprospiraceae bacterium]